MSRTFLLYHIVLVTKGRRQVIDMEHERDVYRILFHILDKLECYVHRINGMPDHIHILLDAPAKLSPAKLVGELKRQSSLVIGASHVLRQWPGWVEGYYLESHSRESLERVKNYIINQKKHHAGLSFDDEYRTLLHSQGAENDGNDAM